MTNQRSVTAGQALADATSCAAFGTELSINMNETRLIGVAVIMTVAHCPRLRRLSVVRLEQMPRLSQPNWAAEVCLCVCVHD